VTERVSALVERLNRANAERLVAISGGTRLHVPGRLANAGRLTKLLGEDLAILVVLHFGDSRLAVPLTLDGPGGPRKPVDLRKLKRLVAKGWSSARIARELQCSERTIYAKRAALRSRTSRQPR
jgi:hypothetical protein